MKTEACEFSTIADSLLGSTRELADSSDPRTRVRAIHRLAAGVETLERQVLLDAPPRLRIAPSRSLADG